MKTIYSTNKTYQCDLCKKTFEDKRNYYRHINKKKTACLSKEQAEGLLDENKTKENRINYYETKTRLQEEQIKKLQKKINK